MTTGGTLKLFCPQNNNQFQDTSKELESVHHANDLITHAAFASEKSAFIPPTLVYTKPADGLCDSASACGNRNIN